MSSKLSFKDHWGACKARCGINRMNYKVEPGVYSVGDPDSSSPVLVTANYKMTFDAVRKELAEISAWLLVLDTKGINVWCAAGKGTFGTEELVKRIGIVDLSQIVEHRSLILPQLGAVGVSAHKVQSSTGFKVIYGPVKASDIPEFLRNGMNTDHKMRTVRFDLADRAVLAPMEVAGAIKPSLILFGIMFLLNLLGLSHFNGKDIFAYTGAVLIGCVAIPVLLPWIPGRAFSFKGWLLGLLWNAGMIASSGGPQSMQYGLFTAMAYLLIFPPVSAFFAMNFTGCSTYTSYSGVIKEMKTAIPLIIVSIAAGIVLLFVGYFLRV